MKNAIILISAPSKYGKTTSIRKIYELLGGDLSTERGDFEKIIDYKGHKIGIITYGDPFWVDTQLKYLDEYANDNAEIIICASRSSGQTRENVISIANKYKYRDLIEVKPYFNDERIIVNNSINLKDEFAQAIVNLVDKIF